MAHVGTGTAGKVLTANGVTSGASFQEIGSKSGLTQYGVIIGAGQGAFQVTAVGSTGQVLTANSGANPTWEAIPSSGIPTIGASTNNGIVTWNGTTGSAVNSTAMTVSSTGIVNGLGSDATTPTYSFLGDTNTGMYSDLADNLKFATGGSLHLTIGSGGLATFFNGLSITSDNFTFAQGFVGVMRSVAGNITGATSDYILNVTSTASARTVTVPNSANSNQIFIIKDGSGGAATNNITVTTPGGTKTFDGQTSVAIATNWGSLTVAYDGSNYLIL